MRRRLIPRSVINAPWDDIREELAAAIELILAATVKTS